MSRRRRRLQRGAASPYVFVNSEASALVARFSSQPNNTRKLLIDNTFTALKAGALSGTNLLTKLDVLHVVAAHDEQAGQRNWIADTANLSPVNSPTFTADRGYSGDAVSQHVTWGIAWNAGGQYTQDSACLFTWETSEDNAGGFALGTSASSGLNHLIRGRTGGSASAVINDGTALTFVQASSMGLTLINRSASNAKQLYRNASSIASSATASTATGITNTACYLRNNATYSTRRVGAGGKGASLTANEVADLYNALQTYMTAVGA
jgi:hypothetical protein